MDYKNLIYLIGFCISFSCVNASMCYQEFANVSTACGGLDTGIYYISGFTSPENASDGDWATRTNNPSSGGQFYINYSIIPELGLNQLWVLKGKSYKNYTLPLECYSAQSILQIQKLMGI